VKIFQKANVTVGVPPDRMDSRFEFLPLQQTLPPLLSSLSLRPVSLLTIAKHSSRLSHKKKQEESKQASKQVSKRTELML